MTSHVDRSLGVSACFGGQDNDPAQDDLLLQVSSVSDNEPGSTDKKECVKCRSLKLTTEFFLKTYLVQRQEVHYSKCKQCISEERNERHNTLEGFLKLLLGSAKSSAGRRKSKGRATAGTFDLSYDYILSLWHQQQGRCFYSKLDLTTRRHSTWQCSLERLNVNMGYIEGNVVLCCCEFNNAYQWTLAKIYSILTVRLFSSLHVDFYPAVQRKKATKTILKLIEGVEHVQCTKCKIFKPKDQFNAKVSCGCKNCLKLYQIKYLSTPQGHFRMLMGSATGRAKKKKMSFDLTYDGLVALFNRQGGRCAYSDIPLQFGPHADNDWVCSIERIDTEKGYLFDNICLICVEFNTSSRLCACEEFKSGDATWNKCKFEQFIARLRCNNE